MSNKNTQKIEKIIAFIENTLAKQSMQYAVIAVSGGIDSAVSLSLLARALPKQNIFTILLPYGRQNMDDAKTMCVWNSIPHENWLEINIKKGVDAICGQNKVSHNDKVRRGNVMARVRMIFAYDLAKAENALVCGTENKSERYLGYFTRFGDAASDIEPISTLYKTQVRELAQELGIPQQILTKHPSAGLWNEQTDEDELGFTYEQADKVLEQLIDKKKKADSIVIEGISPETIQRVSARVQSNRFKREVPYTI